MEFEPTRERTLGERLFDILGMGELAGTWVDYDGGMTAAEYVGERGHPDAVQTFATFVMLHDALVEQGHTPEEVPEFVQMRDGHRTAMSHRLGATYDEQTGVWMIPGEGNTDAAGRNNPES